MTVLIVTQGFSFTFRLSRIEIWITCVVVWPFIEQAETKWKKKGKKNLPSGHTRASLFVMDQKGYLIQDDCYQSSHLFFFSLLCKAGLIEIQCMLTPKGKEVLHKS